MKFRQWHEYIPEINPPVDSIHVDLGAGGNPRNPLNCDLFLATDFHKVNSAELNINTQFDTVDLTRKLPYESNSIFSFSAFDVLEHIPRWERTASNEIIFPFVNLMSEIYRCLKPGGYFIAVTPAYPSPVAFQDPTHVNIITKETLNLYFCGENPWSNILEYGFDGNFIVIENEWLQGDAVMRGTTFSDCIRSNSSFREKIKRLLRANKIILGLARILKGHSFFEEKATHLLWVVRKPH